MNKKLIACYETDASRLVGKAEKVIFPKTIEEIQNIIKTSKLDVVPRGGGTGLAGGAVPYNSIVMDLSKMNKIIDFNKTRNLACVEAGITIKELNEKLNSIGFEFPIQPLNQSTTIGAMTALNIPGFRCVKYGKMKNWVEEIEFVDGRGELKKTSKADLGDICGMEGITGVIVRIKLKVAPKIKRSISIFQTNNLGEALLTARRLKLEKEVVMLELFSKQVSKMLGFPEKYHLIVEFDSDRGKIKGEDYNEIMELKEKAYYILLNEAYYNIETYKFFFDKLEGFILYLESNNIPYFGYLGSGTIYSFFRDEEESKMKEMIRLVKKVGGKIEGGGIGIKRKGFLDDFEKKIIQRVKLRHDPFGKLNKGKIIDFEEKIIRESPKNVQHLRPLRKEEIDKIKPLIGEKMSAVEFKEGKSPEDKISEFVGKIEVLDEADKEVGVKVSALTSEKNKIGKSEGELGAEPLAELLKDYEFTYESELPEERREKVEEFARNVAWNISKKTEEKRESERKEEEKK